MRIPRTVLSIAIIAVLILLIVVVRDLIKKNINVNDEYVTNNTAGLSYRIPQPYKTVPITDAELKIGMVGKFLQSNPISQISIRIDPTMPMEAGLIKLSIKDYQEQNVAELYQQYPEYRRLSIESDKIIDKSATVLVFGYLGLDKKTHMQMEVFAFILNEKPYFIEFQAPESNFKALQSEWKNFKNSLKTL